MEAAAQPVTCSTICNTHNSTGSGGGREGERNTHVSKYDRAGQQAFDQPEFGGARQLVQEDPSFPLHQSGSPYRHTHTTEPTHHKQQINRLRVL